MMTMKTCEVELLCTVAEAWRVLTDVEAWAYWMPGVTSARGSVTPGTTLALSIEGTPAVVEVEEVEEESLLVLTRRTRAGLRVERLRIALAVDGWRVVVRVESEIRGLLAGAASSLLDPVEVVEGLEREVEPRVWSAEELAGRAPRLVADYVAVSFLEPNVYYRWTDEGMDESGGGLGPYDLGVLTERDGCLVPSGVVRDGGYDGPREEPHTVFHDRPAGLGEPLWLPALLLVGLEGRSLLIRGVETARWTLTPTTFRDAFGEERVGYGRLDVPLARDPAMAEELATSGVLALRLRLRPAAVHHLLRRDFAEAVAAVDGLLRTCPVAEATIDQPVCFSRLPDWQEGRIRVLD
jgi:hypothetical protein